MKKIVSMVAAAALIGATFSANAALILSNAGGAWINALPPGTLTTNINNPGSGIDMVRWGGTVNNPNTGSGYDFDPVDNPLPPLVMGSPFLLATFTHHNEVVFSSITSIQYAFSLSTNGNPALLTDTFNFAHNETPNSPPCVAPSTTPCSDIVTVSSVSLNQVITEGGDTYFFNLLGFSTDGGATISSQFISNEDGSNSAGLYAVVTLTPISEPGALALLAAALAGFGFATRRKV